MQKKILSILVILCLIGIILFFTNHGSIKENSDSISKSGFYFNTVITITLYDTTEASYLEECFSMAEKYENMLSTTIPDSDIARINAAAGEPVTVSEETVELLKDGLYYCDLSDGNFDITIGKLSGLWDLPNNEGTVPDATEIAAAVNSVGYQAVVINGNTVTLANPDAAIDLGGIAKGFIADKMKAYLNKNGITSGTINLGGNVLTLGEKADGSDYLIGIQKPFADTGTAIAAVSIKDKTVVSSGIYERYFEKDGTLYHHILNPKDGYPYQNDLLSVTIICDRSVDGDGLSTTCFAFGLEQGMALIESLPDTEAIFITKDYELHTSSGIGTEIPLTEITE